MVSTRPRTSKSSSPFNNLLVTVPKATITIGMIVTIMFHSFPIPLEKKEKKNKYLDLARELKKTMEHDSDN